ncbi:MAG TPA: twin-arginine translocase TatA/TatE family subunit [Syntrophomonadaceae bacterium]|nr:twin-arginine translocase TatA/TatE family subunit [Syntrophomonadaceae bacterium]
MPNIGPWELIAILAIVLIIFGPGKLPDVGKSLGNTIKEFRKASKETTDQVEDALKESKPIEEPEK